MTKYYRLRALELHEDILQAQDQLDDSLKVVRLMEEEIPEEDPYYKYLKVILDKCPPEYTDNYYYSEDVTISATQDNLVKIHRKLIHDVDVYQRNKSLYNELLHEAFAHEDIMAAKTDGFKGKRRVEYSFRPHWNKWAAMLQIPFFEWIWKVW
eukprot:CAMPEP_0174267434 /NCGR_PEP_ID=MMETSP0439-20130205/33597_1 /TAXON_ID=0 /ORGANISM="Stereomyxa ramosa, Strain Chinc5" /LENGTH=152 /DNA_ID=CAMNT_0015354929 /DNA_START=531 /DNA_END=986 /DNA_ORIENTATION=+